jgi:predicted dienelactone hydrolase
MRRCLPAPESAIKVVALILLLTLIQGQGAAPSYSQATQSQPSDCIQSQQSQTNDSATKKCTKLKIAGLHVAVWKPAATGKAPLVIFSHGSGGKNTQSKFIMTALAQAGYLVIAPNHKDATFTGISLRPDFTYKRASRWNDKSFESRRTDIVKLLDGLHSDPDWDKQIDWSKLALSGHSLGGYTILGLCGAWPKWKIEGVKAALGFSPYCKPFVDNGELGAMKVPVMYQGGTKDSITRSIEGTDGAFSQTSAPAYFVEFDRAGHLAWTNFNHKRKQKDLIIYYSLAFLDKYLKGGTDTNLETRLEGVAVLEKK